jgi:PAS domain-containing protein
MGVPTSTSFFTRSRIFRSLSAKFLLVFIPVFILISILGVFFLAQSDRREDRDHLATRIGNQAARVTSAFARHDAKNNSLLAQDLIASIATDRAVLCAEYRENDTNRLVAVMPRRIGCKNITAGHRLMLPIGNGESGSLLVVFSDAEISKALEFRRNLVLLLIGTPFLVSTFSALAGFRLIVGRPLERLHASIKHLSETGERNPVKGPVGDKLGDIIGAFNGMLEREEQKDQRLDQANRKIMALNRTLEGHVAERTNQLHASEQRLRQLVEQFGSGIYIHAKFKPIYANQTLLDMFGFDGQEDFLSIGSTEFLLAPEERPRVWGYH